MLESVKVSGKTLKIKSNTPLSIIIICLIILWGCAKKEVLNNVPDEEVLRNRVVKYWDHKVKGEFDKSYEYELPLYKTQFSVVSYIKGINTARASWVGAEVGTINMENDNAMVDVKLRIKVIQQALPPKAGVDFQKQSALVSPNSVETEALIKEQWIKVDGSWYHVPSKMLKERGNN